MREYDQPTLHRVQQLELMILRDFMQFCDQNGLQYFGLGGTGIGAVRNQGFIPWDDDIDIALPRKDYDAFVRLATEQLSDKYIIMNPDYDPNFPLMTTRMMLKGTKFREESLKDIHCELGIFLDIYAYDQLADDPKAYKKQCRDASLLAKLMILRSIPFPVLPFKGWKAKLAHAATAVVHGFMVLFRISKPWLAKKCKEVALRYEDAPATQRLGYLFYTDPNAEQYLRTDLFPLKPYPFEDVELPFGNNLHANLSRIYGDYMQLPPPEKRKNHFPYELDFGPYGEVPLEEIPNMGHFPRK